MATGNLFLGTARRKIGDVVLYRREGVQQSRVRVRSIANPKTDGQALQRNYIAPVAKFYAPLAGVLERSWENLSRSKSYTAFLKRNLDKARSEGWYLPKGASFFPLPYQLSYGILPPLDVAWNNGVVRFVPHTADGDTATLGTLSASLIAKGYREGDQVTLLAVYDNGDSYRPAWSRFLINPADTRTLDAIQQVKIEKSGTFYVLDDLGAEEQIVAGAVIISRYEGGVWRRSTQSLVVSSDLMAAVTSEDARAAAIASFQGAGSIVTSEIYLNGGTGTRGSSSIADLLVPFYPSGSPTAPARIFTPSRTVAGPVVSGTAMLAVQGSDAANGANVVPLLLIDFGVNTGKYITYAKTAVAAPSGVTTYPVVKIRPGMEDFIALLEDNGVPASLFATE